MDLTPLGAGDDHLGGSVATDRPRIATGDIVLCRGGHGIGVVWGIKVYPVVRFPDGKSEVTPVPLLTVMLAASRARQSPSEVLASGQLDGSLARGAALWLLLSDAELQAVAVALFARTRDLKLIEIAAETLETFTPSDRSAVTARLSEARASHGLDSWPEAVAALAPYREARRRRYVAETRQLAEAKQRAELAELREPSVRLQIDRINFTRQKTGQPALTEAECERIGAALWAAWDAPASYKSHCWNCQMPVSSRFNKECQTCGWLVCVCGSCRSPHYVDARRGAGPCPRDRSARKTVGGFDGW